MLKNLICLTTALLGCQTLQAETRFDFSGRVSGEARWFIQESAQPDYTLSGSVAVEPQFYWEWGDGSDSLAFTPFLRFDQRDDERTHADIREFSWVHVGDDWELRSGIRKVFWGVTEFQHLVDIINQTDGVEDIDGEDKLGQPMVNLSLVRDWGILDLFLLPGFRPRTFAGEEARLRSSLVVSVDNARYESAAGSGHLDGAIRWSHTLGDFDIGAYWFHGTSRDPQLEPVVHQGRQRLIPFYPQIDQLGIDLQATLDSWLWKLEVIHRDSSIERYTAAQGGFEYTLYGIRDSASDLGLLLEYGWDERGERAFTVAQNDLFGGLRLALNDVAGSELLAGISYDLDFHSRSFMVEASRRFGDQWKLRLEGRLFDADHPSDPLSQLRRQDHLQLTAEYYF